jgi:DNA integrity scanning protein DisA with diadenylate cyclase activity
LPVSEDQNLPMSFGMRHRAAYAISEDTDALAIVISEEHNTISIFINGDINKNLTIVELRSHIVEYLESDYEKKS